MIKNRWPQFILLSLSILNFEQKSPTVTWITKKLIFEYYKCCFTCAMMLIKRQWRSNMITRSLKDLWDYRSGRKRLRATTVINRVRLLWLRYVFLLYGISIEKRFCFLLFTIILFIISALFVLVFQSIFVWALNTCQQMVRIIIKPWVTRFFIIKGLNPRTITRKYQHFMYLRLRCPWCCNTGPRMWCADAG